MDTKLKFHDHAERVNVYIQLGHLSREYKNTKCAANTYIAPSMEVVYTLS